MASMDDIYAYEQEMNEMDEWEMMHANEMEAANEALMEMESAEKQIKPANEETEASLDGVEATMSKAQQRLDDVLDRCNAALGEDEDTFKRIRDTDPLLDQTKRSETSDAASKEAQETREYVHSHPPINSGSQTIHLSQGRRFFLRKKSKIDAKDRSNGFALDPNALLKTPIAQLRDAIEKRNIERSVRDEDDVQSVNPSMDETLWLDKYRASRFVDLLSDERTNREVLSWMKAWDHLVFHRDKMSKKDDVDDNDPRPKEKIILLCGPPGAGKTTLAHIVARHAGYNPIEVNASDDRTASVLQTKIQNATEMQSIYGSQKPNCVILDELDGAMNGGEGRSAISVLTSMINAPLHQKGGKNRPITRPLICICNDQYAPVLRPLRQIAKTFVLAPPSAQRLVSRLKYICKKEELSVSAGGLSSLAGGSSSDIRYCINALQFQRHSHQVGKSTSLAPKDQTRGVLDTISCVFYQPARQAKVNAEDAAMALNNSTLLLQTLEQNLPRLVFNDPTLAKLQHAMDWLGVADNWDANVRAEQQFAMAAYVPFAAVAVEHACATTTRRKLEYPYTALESQRKADKSLQIVQSLQESAAIGSCVRLSRERLATDVLPWVTSILAPAILQANASLQSKEERKMVERLTQVMATLGVSFQQKYTPDGKDEYLLEPPVHELVEFKGLSRRSMLPPGLRKMVSREVELEQMRRTEASEEGKGDKNVKKTAKAKVAEVTEKDELEAMKKRNPFAFAHREAKRKRQEQDQKEEEKEGGADKKPRVRYNFNEGYTSGIKTDVFMKDLIA